MAQPIISRQTARAFRYYGASQKPFSVDGLTEAYAALDAIPEAVRDFLADIIDTGSAIIESEAHRRVPIDEGDLDRSIGRNVREDGLQAAVGSDLEYAPFVELGTAHAPAQPWLYPAYLAGARFIRRRTKDFEKETGMRLRVRSKRRVKARK